MSASQQQQIGKVTTQGIQEIRMRKDQPFKLADLPIPDEIRRQLAEDIFKQQFPAVFRPGEVPDRGAMSTSNETLWRRMCTRLCNIG